MITIIAKFNVLNGSVDEFKKCAVNVVRDTRKEKGNLAYKIYQSREDATKFTFIEEWLNDTAIEQHNNAKHFLQFLDVLKKLKKMQSIVFNFLRTSNRLQMVTFKSNSLQKYRLYSAD